MPPWNAGKKMSLELREKLSIAHLGHKHSDETKRKLLLIRIEKGKNATGRRCLRYSKWRQMVFERDNFTCQDCGCTNKEKKLHPHHIIKWADNIELRFNLGNGMTLCTKCHNKIHGFQKGVGYWTGKKRSLEDKEKIAKTKRGIPLTEEHKQKLRDVKKLNPTNSGSFVKGQLAWNKGISPNLETRKRMGIAQEKRFDRERSEA